MRGDINLLPKRKAKDSTKLASSFIAAVIIVSLLSFIFMVFIPTKEKVEIENEIAQKEAELDNYTGTREEYNELITYLNLLNNRIKSYDYINESNYNSSEILADVESAIPANILLNSFSYSDNILSISGETTRPDPVLVSQFMVNLRQIEDIINVTMPAISSTENGYVFSMTADYYLPPTEEETTEETTNDGQASDETEEEIE